MMQFATGLAMVALVVCHAAGANTEGIPSACDLASVDEVRAVAPSAARATSNGVDVEDGVAICSYVDGDGNPKIILAMARPDHRDVRDALIAHGLLDAGKDYVMVDGLGDSAGAVLWPGDARIGTAPRLMMLMVRAGEIELSAASFIEIAPDGPAFADLKALMEKAINRLPGTR